jgi:hypothetical protein
MGSWNHGADGSSLHTEETGLIWGDGPADIFDKAIADAARVFAEDVGREPTEEELMAGFRFSLNGWPLRGWLYEEDRASPVVSETRET